MLCHRDKEEKLYLLIHGAWHAAWCWEPVIAHLKSAGYRVAAPNLPGHGTKGDSCLGIQLSTYVDFVTNIILAQHLPVVLVGHSMAGVIISQVAENIPARVEQLIYVAAFIPKNQQSLLQVAKKSRTDGIAKKMLIDENQNTITLKISEQISKIFYNCCHVNQLGYALSLLQPEPFQPFVNPITISLNNFGMVKKLYIECLYDAVILPADQRRMYSGIVDNVVSIAADHSPFFSRPRELADIIMRA